MSHVQSLADALRAADEQLEAEIKTKREYHETKKRKIESNYLAKQILDGEGINLEIPTYCKDDITHDSTPAEIGKIIQALGSKFKPDGRKSVVPNRRKYVWVYLKSEEFPGLELRYQAKVKKGAKCRIIRTRHAYTNRSVVCDI